MGLKSSQTGWEMGLKTDQSLLLQWEMGLKYNPSLLLQWEMGLSGRWASVGDGPQWKMGPTSNPPFLLQWGMDLSQINQALLLPTILERLSTQIQVQQIDASMQPSMHSSQEAERIISELSQVRQDANVTLGSFQQKVSELGVYVGDYTRNHEELQRLRVTVPEQERKIQELEQTRDRLVDKCVKQQTDLNTFRKACEDRQKSLKEKVEEIDNYKAELQCFTKGVTLLSDLKTLPGSKLHIAIADLKRFYEQEYRRQPVVLAHTKMILQQKIQQVVADESFLELGENIANALNAYLATVEESSSLHADVKRQAIEIQRLKKQLQHLKDASILQPEE
ncbi:hypothetical protein MAR_023231 [Mya arenaria]|uniref:Uncharacterized protein n=1 Tax=Mya arenaria TaxID=6604 RepID=A0ABY7DPQ9_MYAAR|nr:hypothetical protein MAR_023231 [Mya arenaria]